MSMSKLVFPLFGGGKTKFQPVFVGDVAQAVANAIADDRTRGKTYELGGPAVYTFKELLAFIARVTGAQAHLHPDPVLPARYRGRIHRLAAVCTRHARPSAPPARRQRRQGGRG